MTAQTMKPGRYSRRGVRSGVSTVEFAIVGSVCFLFLIGLLLLETAVFRFEAVASMAHEGARWAAVHGKRFENFKSIQIDADDVYQNAILPRAKGMDLRKLEYSVTWDEKKSLVKVTVRYKCLETAYTPGMTLSCTSHMLISF
jgi:hypothetical protein